MKKIQSDDQKYLWCKKKIIIINDERILCVCILSIQFSPYGWIKIVSHKYFFLVISLFCFWNCISRLHKCKCMCGETVFDATIIQCERRNICQTQYSHFLFFLSLARTQNRSFCLRSDTISVGSKCCRYLSYDFWHCSYLTLLIGIILECFEYLWIFVECVFFCLFYWECDQCVTLNVM